MTRRFAMSMVLVFQLLLTSVLGPNYLCLCSDGCDSIEVEEAGACCPSDECRPPVFEVVLGLASDSCCDWCFTIPGDTAAKLAIGSGVGPTSEAPWIDAAITSPRRACERGPGDRTVTASGPPPSIAHLRTVRLLV